MNKKEIKKTKKLLITFLEAFLIFTILLVIQMLFINFNGAYYGNCFQKYYSFLKDNSVYPKQKSIFPGFIVFGIAFCYYLIKFIILKVKNKNDEHISVCTHKAHFWKRMNKKFSKKDIISARRATPKEEKEYYENYDIR